jgi:hypothetical protein
VTFTAPENAQAKANDATLTLAAHKANMMLLRVHILPGLLKGD